MPSQSSAPRRGDTDSFDAVAPASAPRGRRAAGRRRPAAAAALAALLAAAGGGVAVQAAGGEPPRAQAAAVTVHAANGAVRIPHRPKRIVVLSPSATETLFAIGAGRQVVAVDDQSNVPRRAPQTKLSSYRPNAEAVARYRPDLVVTSTSANRLLPALKKLRIPVLLAPAPATLGGAYAQWRQLGLATGHRAAAARLVSRTRKRIAAAVRHAGRGRALSLYHELTPDLYSATSRTFIGRIYRLFGLRNIADRAGKGGDYPQLSAEYVVAANPDAIVLADTKCCGQSARTVAKRPGWDAIAAVRRGRVVAMNDDIPSRWGPRIADFAEQVARLVRRARSGS